MVALAERKLHIDASPEVVFDVVSRPEHVREWWPDEAENPVEPGGEGRICFGDPADGGTWVQFTVVDAVPHQGWEVVGGPEEWIGTEVRFDIRQDGDWTIVLFRHEGWREPVEFTFHCSTSGPRTWSASRSCWRPGRARRTRATCSSATGTDPGDVLGWAGDRPAPAQRGGLVDERRRLPGLPALVHGLRRRRDR
jgi:hypothetical protein